MMDRRRALMASVKASILPSGYTEIECIKVPDTATRYNAYIKFLITPANIKYADVVYTFYQSSSKHIFLSTGTSKAAPYGGVSANSGYTTTIADENGHKKAHMVQTNVSGTTQVNIICGWKDTSYTGYPLIYRFTIVNDSNAIVFDGIPAKRNNDQKYGLFDVISKTFRPSDGSVDFEGGQT